MMITIRQISTMAGIVALTIAIQGCSTMEGYQSSMMTSPDAKLSARVEAALQKDPRLAGSEIQVASTNSEVRLTGLVDTRPQRNDATAVAGQVAGVRHVANELRLNNGD